MNRVDLALAIEAVGMVVRDTADDEWLRVLGRELKRNARLNAAVAHHQQSTAITTRVEGWRKLGEPKGYSFAPWTSMSETAFRNQCRLAVRRSKTAEKQLALLLVRDVLGAA